MMDKLQGDRLYGYTYDLWMYSVNAAEAEADRFEFNALHCKKTEYTRFNSWFPFCDSGGIFFDFVSCKDEVGGTVFLKKDDRKNETYFRVPWRTSEETEDTHYIKVHHDYKKPIVEAITKVIDCSPIRKGYFLVRRQCREKYNVIGMLTVRQMENIIMNGELLGNVVYSIYDI